MGESQGKRVLMKALVGLVDKSNTLSNRVDRCFFRSKLYSVSVEPSSYRNLLLPTLTAIHADESAPARLKEPPCEG